MQSILRILRHPISLWLVAPPLLLACLGFLVGSRFVSGEPKLKPVDVPLPHHIAKYPGNLTLRFAMVHDVIHERFPRHGPDYYRARNQSTKEALKKFTPTEKGAEADEYFRLLDDLGVGLEFLGFHQEAVNLLRDKLKRQQELGYEGKELYSTYANLGTVLILWQLTEGVKDVVKAKERIGESVQWIHKAIAVNPESHFGREVWQVVLEEFLLAVLDDPNLLLRFDMVGNRLDKQYDWHRRGRAFDESAWLSEPPGPSRSRTFRNLISPSLAVNAGEYLKNPDAKEDPSKFRAVITKVGAEAEWNEAVKTSHQTPVAFDEPTLGIVGMWRMGAGANPHFALALGNIMMRVGQRHIAWAAYERAARLKDGFWPDPTIQKKFEERCRYLQQTIEIGAERPGKLSWVEQFDRDLNLGQAYQKAYQEYETKQLAYGASVDDPHFYDSFEASFGPIASKVGKEEMVFLEEKPLAWRWAWAIFLAGLFAFVTALAQMMLARKSGSKITPP